MAEPQIRRLEIRSLRPRDPSLVPLLNMYLGNNVKTLCSKVRTRMRREDRRARDDVRISVPFDFKRENTALPGISHTELALLREKAAASRIGVADVPRPVSAFVIHPAFDFPCSQGG